jgi:hypothetical protein
MGSTGLGAGSGVHWTVAAFLDVIPRSGHTDP